MLRWYIKLYRGRAWYTKALLFVASLIVAFLMFVLMVLVNFLGLFGSCPTPYDVKHIKSPIASEVYSDDGVQIGKFYNENRSPVSYKAITPEFWHALVDTEDERFYEHNGIDLEAVLGAMKDAALRNKARGASTITQQLAKNLFHTRSSHSTGPLCHVPVLGMAITKTKEWFTALLLEFSYSKDEILLMYANTVEFGGNIYGIKTAAKAYFNKTPKELSVDECAILVGMLKAITTYNPRINPENSLQRRNVVMQLMHKHGHLSAAELERYSALPISLSLNFEKTMDGQAPYFREAVAKELEVFCDEEGYDLYEDGLKIYTTIDTRMQKFAEQAAWNQMSSLQSSFNAEWSGDSPWRDEHGNPDSEFINKTIKKLPVYEQLNAKFPNDPDSINYYLNKKHKVKVFTYENSKHYVEKEMSTIDSLKYMVKFLHCSFVAMEPSTGYVRAYVGDVDFNTWQYDKARAMRQPGSTFKLFVYTEAMNQGLTPCDRRRDENFTLTVWDSKQHKNVVWSPGNAGGRFSGDSLTLKTAFARSINSIAVRLGQELGMERIAETAHDMGIQSKLDVQPSLALGASDVTLFEMVNAYSTIANNGVHVKPVLVTKILDHDGNVVYTSKTKEDRAIPAVSAFYVQQLLKGGLQDAHGTSVPLRSYVEGFTDTDFGGKTGTTNNNSDGWYMCVSPNLVCGAWVGGEYRGIHFRTGGYGGRTALPICGRFMHAVLGDSRFYKYRGHFQMPSGVDFDEAMFTCEPVRKANYNDSTYYSETDTVDYDEYLRNIDQDALINEEDLGESNRRDDNSYRDEGNRRRNDYDVDENLINNRY